MIGDLIEGGANLIGNEYKRDAAREAIRAQQGGIRDARAIGDVYYDESGKLVQDQFGKGASTYEEDLAAWRELAATPGQEMSTFDDTIDIASMLDPAVDYRQKQAADVISQSAANAGGMFSGSGATAKALQDRSQAIASDEWGKAYNRADDAMKGKYSRFTDKFKADKMNEATRLNNMRGLFNQSSTDRSNLFSGQQAAQAGKANLGMTTARQLAGLDADVLMNDGTYMANQLKTGGNMVGRVAEEAQNSLFPTPATNQGNI